MIELSHLNHVLSTAAVIHSESEVERAIDRMAGEIEAAYKDRNPLMLCVMNGGLFFAAALYRRLQFPLQQDYMHIGRYRNATKGGEIEWRVKPSVDLAQRHVLVLDDILDEGVTLQEIIRYCRDMQAASVEVAVLTRKIHDRCIDNVSAKYIGLDVPDRYVFGCGMDYQGYFRNLNAIYALTVD